MQILKILKKTFPAVFVPTIFALVVYGVFDFSLFSGLYSVMSLSFLAGLPFSMGILSLAFFRFRGVPLLYSILLPWLSLLCFFLITYLLEWESLACWLMVMVPFLGFASAGGIVGYRVILTQRGSLLLPALVLLPFLGGALEESAISTPETYESTTVVEIYHPNKEAVWEHVLRVGEISEAEDSRLLAGYVGLPRPVEAQFDYAGIGGCRQAVFDQGLQLEEEVTAYEAGRLLQMSIRATPDANRLQGLDEHLAVGGRFFDVLAGTYELEPLGPSHYRLYLSCRFCLDTPINFYASWWARYIMEDIQGNILQVIKARVEQKSHNPEVMALEDFQ